MACVPGGAVQKAVDFSFCRKRNSPSQSLLLCKEFTGVTAKFEFTSFLGAGLSLFAPVFHPHADPRCAGQDWCPCWWSVCWHTWPQQLLLWHYTHSSCHPAWAPWGLEIMWENSRWTWRCKHSSADEVWWWRWFPNAQQVNTAFP